MTAEPRRVEQAVPPWRNLRVLRISAQVAAITLVALLAWWLWGNLVTNLRSSGLSFGFGFLNSTAGFEIGETVIDYSARDTYGQAFLVGLANTVLVSVVGIVLATILGLITGIARLSRNFLVNRLAAGYVELMRNTPLLVQLVLIYAVLIQLPPVARAINLAGSVYLSQRGLYLPRPTTEPGFGAWLVLLAAAIAVAVGLFVLANRREELGQPSNGLRKVAVAVLLSVPLVAWLVLDPVELDLPVPGQFNFSGGVALSPELAALLFGLVIYTAAFIGEIVRGAIQAVRRGQVEAAESLGLTSGQTLRLIVFPQALRILVPPLTSQYLNLAKNSSLAIAVGFADLFSVSRTMANQTGDPVAVIILVMGTYLLISLVTSLVMNVYNRRVQVLEH
jgi:general L-amino acid transport system permease protein